MKKFLYDSLLPVDLYLHDVLDRAPPFSLRCNLAGWLHGLVHEACYILTSEPELIALRKREREQRRSRWAA